ncbi:hypothetical protein HNS03_23580 [Amorphus sp. 3PC139-8]
MFALEQARRDIARRRERWKIWQPHLDPQRLVFLDETWIKTNMAPRYGGAAKGERLRAFAPHGHWRTMTFLAALRCDGLTAPCVFDSPINGCSAPMSNRCWCRRSDLKCCRKRKICCGLTIRQTVSDQNDFGNTVDPRRSWATVLPPPSSVVWYGLSSSDI